MTLVRQQPSPSDEPCEHPLTDWEEEHCGHKYHKEIWAWVSGSGSSSMRGLSTTITTLFVSCEKARKKEEGE